MILTDIKEMISGINKKRFDDVYAYSDTVSELARENSLFLIPIFAIMLFLNQEKLMMIWE